MPIVRLIMRLFNCSIQGHTFWQIDGHPVCSKCLKGERELERSLRRRG